MGIGFDGIERIVFGKREVPKDLSILDTEAVKQLTAVTGLFMNKAITKDEATDRKAQLRSHYEAAQRYEATMQAIGELMAVTAFRLHTGEINEAFDGLVVGMGEVSRMDGSVFCKKLSVMVMEYFEHEYWRMQEGS